MSCCRQGVQQRCSRRLTLCVFPLEHCHQSWDGATGTSLTLQPQLAAVSMLRLLNVAKNSTILVFVPPQLGECYMLRVKDRQQNMNVARHFDGLAPRQPLHAQLHVRSICQQAGMQSVHVCTSVLGRRFQHKRYVHIQQQGIPLGC